MTTALETFKSFSKNKEKNKLDCDLIQLVVAEYYNISVSQLKGKLRNTNIVLARQIAMYLCRTMLDCSFKKIGEEFGGKDHSTVIASIAKVEKMLKENSDYLIAINEIKEIIKKH
jgi:chromosomal replication initiator protein